VPVDYFHYRCMLSLRYIYKTTALRPASQRRITTTAMQMPGGLNGSWRLVSVLRRPMDNVARHSLARRNAQQLTALQLHVIIIVGHAVLLDPLHVELLEAVNKLCSITPPRNGSKSPTSSLGL